VSAATSNQVPSAIGQSGIRPNLDGRGTYGFNWWVNGIKPNGARKWPSVPASTFAAYGHNENKMFVIPDWDLLVVRTGDSGSIDDGIWDEFLRRIAASVVVR
jgi:hypothetical protein